MIGRVDRQEVRTFKLNQIEELNVLDKCFVDDENFNIQEYLGKAWSTTPEGRLYNIKLKFLPEVARAVAEIQWHSTQMVTFADDGSAIVEFRVDGLDEILPWILSYGDKVKVISPEVLRQQVTQTAQNTIIQNSEVLSSGESAGVYAAK